MRTLSPAAVDGGFLIGEPGTSRVAPIDPHDGRESAEWSLPQRLVDRDIRAAFTSAEDDRVVVRCGDHAVVEIAPTAGTVRELVVAANPLSAVAPQYAGDLLCLLERGSGLTAVDPRAGGQLWRVDLRQRLVDHVVAVATETGPRLVVASSAGVLFQLDADGQVVGRTSVARRIDALRRLGPACVLAVTKGTLLAIDVD